MLSPSSACRTAMESSTVLNEHTIRRKDFSGDQDANVAVVLMMSRNCVICGCANISSWFRFVMRSVFEGFAGCVRGGIDDRSRVRCDPREEARERFGDENPSPLGESCGDCCGESIVVCAL